MIGTTNPMERLAKGRMIHMERFTGIDRPAFLPGGKTPQEDIDTCVDRCPWPSKPMMCSRCKGHPELVKDIYKGRMEHLNVKEHTIRAMIMWLEWRAKQPGNPNPERTLEILRGIRHDKAV